MKKDTKPATKKATTKKATVAKKPATKATTKTATKKSATKAEPDTKATKHSFRLLLPSGESSELVANRQVEMLVFTFSDGSEMALTKEECAELGSQGFIALGDCTIVRE